MSSQIFARVDVNPPPPPPPPEVTITYEVEQDLKRGDTLTLTILPGELVEMLRTHGWTLSRP